MNSNLLRVAAIAHMGGASSPPTLELETKTSPRGATSKTLQSRQFLLRILTKRRKPANPDVATLPVAQPRKIQSRI